MHPGRTLPISGRNVGLQPPIFRASNQTTLFIYFLSTLNMKAARFCKTMNYQTTRYRQEISFWSLMAVHKNSRQDLGSHGGGYEPKFRRKVSPLLATYFRMFSSLAYSSTLKATCFSKKYRLKFKGVHGIIYQ